MASLMPRTQRDQLMVILAVLGLLGAGAYWYYVYNPGGAEIAKSGLRVDSLDIKNQDAKKQMAKGTVEQLRADAESYKSNLTLMRQLVPAANEVTTLIDQIAQTARRVGLDIASVEPLGIEEGNDFDLYKYRLQVAGGYHSIASLLTNVGSLARIIVPTNVNMLVPQGNAAGLYSSVATFELHTYVARTQPKAPPPSAKPPAGAPPAKGNE
jgi:type IV pilus assembly protein PilO